MARYLTGIRISGFTTILGLGMFLVGILELFAIELQPIPILLILIGVGIVVKPLLEKAQT